jgi:ABC-type transport system involved in multi-copper enzyme maturation permease subunit
MLWYKAWLDTRWRFLTGVAVLLSITALIVFSYNEAMHQTAVLGLDRQIFRSYRAYLWGAGIQEGIRQLVALFAVVLGAGGLLSQASRGGGRFMLSLPISRDQLLWSRTVVGLAQLAALAFLSPLVLTALSPAIGQSYSVIDAMVHGLCLFVGGSLLFSATAWLSTVFNDVWWPPLVALCFVVVIGFVHMLLTGPSPNNLLGVMTGEAWFREQRLPVVGLLVTGTVSALLLYLTQLRLARIDF